MSPDPESHDYDPRLFYPPPVERKETMTQRNDGGPAFPLHNHGVQTLGLPLTGMTLRDYFAARAMVVLMTNDQTDMEEDARDAYLMADLMLKAREGTR